jgi:transcriptional regulator with XRE-family HTH domain
MPITEFGRVVREMRDEADVSLRQMADEIGYSPAFLSAVEIGEKGLSDDLVEQVIGNLRKTGKFQLTELAKLRGAADRTRREVDVSGLSRNGRQAVAVFARRLADMDRHSREELIRRLEVPDEGA